MAQESEEQALISQSAQGDREAFRALVERYQGRLLRLVRTLVRSREDAEDIVQESFVKAYQSLRGFRGDASFYTWLYRIAFNMAIDFKRKVARKAQDSHVEINELDKRQGLASSDASPAEIIQVKEDRELISSALKELSEDHRAVIVLREVDGLSYEEIAKITGVSIGTVMSRLHYARKKLQERLSQVAPPGSRLTSSGAVYDGAVSKKQQAMMSVAGIGTQRGVL